MSKQLRLDVAQLTDVGRKRPHNEDNMAYVIPKDPQVMARKGALFIVADGMGGHAAGEVASEIAVDTVSYSYYQDDSEDVATSLLHAIRRANSLIHQRAAENMLRSGMGTTCVAAVLRGNLAYIANVGDSRAYLIRHAQAKQVSQDHSWVAEQVRAGLLTEDQARSHAQRNVITRCLGTQSEVDVDVFTEQLEEGDLLILCTDGLSGLVGDEELRAIVNKYVPQESVYHLVERANENGGPDNITAIVIRVQEVGWEPPNARYPVRVGAGPEIGGDTALLGRLPSTPLLSPMHADSLHSPGLGLHVPAGSFASPDTITTAPQPAVKATKAGRNRLLYPTAALCALLILAIIASGFYFFLRARGSIVDVDAGFTTVNGLITKSQGDINTNPTNALQELAQARTKLLSMQTSSLNSAQNLQFNRLQALLTRTVQQAITAYNHQYNIASLPCVSTTTTGINSGSTNLQANNVVVVQDNAGKKQTYILASDNNLHSLTGQQLGNVVSVGGPATTQIKAIATDGTQIIALTSLPGKGSYGLSLLVPQNNPTFRPKNELITIPQGYTPNFVSVANNDVSVVLIPQTSSTQYQILNYKLTTAAQPFNPPTKMVISISKTIVSVAALNVAQKTQLLFLFSDGTIQSLPVGSSSPSPVSVQISPTLASPLTVSSTTFTDAQRPVPTPASLVTPSLTPLSVPGATLLATGPTDLYIVATGVNGVGPRILDLQVAAGGAAGGGVATDTTLSMKLMQQYATSSLPVAKGMFVDSAGKGFSLLTATNESATASQLVSVTLPLGKTCVS